MDETPNHSSAKCLIDALRDPACYDHPVGSVQVLETHISWVLLTGSFAYKIKKPVVLPFVDFSTLDRREYYCQEELRLNRRLAPSVYLDVVKITGTPDRPIVNGSGPALEFAVKMRQFEQENLLSRLVARGQLLAADVDSLATQVAAFHAHADMAATTDPFGSPDVVERAMEENFSELLTASMDDHSRSRLNRLQEWSGHEFQTRQADVAARRALGFVRECHGDMHLGNMVRQDGAVVIFDCIEFNESFRWIDVLSEVAFVVMDLEDRGRPDLARRFLNGYLEQTGDYAGLTVLRFYATFRALVRAKVDKLRSAQDRVSASERQRLADDFRGYLDLAERYTQQPAPWLMITHGVSGSGKTTGTQPIVEAIGAVRIRSDVERKRLIGIRPLSRSASPLNDELYSDAATRRTYARLTELAAATIQAGFSVIVDATFLKRHDRVRFRELANQLRAPFVIVDFRASSAALRERVSRRHAEGADASDANLDVLELQLQTAEPLGPDEESAAIRVDTESPHSAEALIGSYAFGSAFGSAPA